MVVSDKTAEQGAPTMPLRSRRGATRVQGGFSADYETSTSTEVLSAFFGVPFIDTGRQTLLSIWISTKNVRRTAECLCCHWCGGTVDARERNPPYGHIVAHPCCRPRTCFSGSEPRSTVSVTVNARIHLTRQVRAVWARCRGTSTGAFTSALMIM